MVKTAKRVMFQGTSSHVGKSILTTAFCRILSQDGYKTAPFKAQNMALNSYVTRSGGEIGRSTVAQAEAAGADPIVQMNPVLLKPTGNSCSQVILWVNQWETTVLPIIRTGTARWPGIP